MDVFGRGGFMDLPPQCIALYSYLTVYADDDGFHGAPIQTARMLGYAADALQTLADAGYIILFESGPAAITHWRLTNTIPKDRYTPTVYQKEYALLDYAPGEGYYLKAEEKQAVDSSKPESAPEETVFTASSTETPQAVDNVNKTEEAPVDPSLCLPLENGGEYTPTAGQMAAWRRLYPSVNVETELRAMRGWLLARPEKQRSATETERFVSYWFTNALKQHQPSISPPPLYRNERKQPPFSYPLPQNETDRVEAWMIGSVPKLRKKK